MACRGGDVDAFEHLQIAIGFMQVADFDNWLCRGHGVGSFALFQPRLGMNSQAFATGVTFSAALCVDCLRHRRQGQLIGRMGQGHDVAKAEQTDAFGR